MRLVTLMRVQTAIRVATKAPVQLLALLFAGRLASRSWIKALEADLSHIALADCLSEFRGAPLSIWFGFFRTYPFQSKRVVIRAVAATNWVTPAEAATEVENSTYCTVCGDPARDRQSLAVHMLRAHGTRRYIRSFVEGLACLVCGMTFVSRQRLVDHLAEKSQVCAHSYSLHYEPLEPQRICELDLAARTEHSRRCRIGGAHGLRIHGPFLPVYSLDGDMIRTRHPLGPHRRWHG